MKIAVRVILLTVVVLLVGLLAGCSVVGGIGGADIRLEALSLGAVAMEGKAITGLPSDNINLVLEVSARSVVVRTGADGTTLTIKPSGATVEIKPKGVSIKGVKPEKIKVEWVTAKKD